MFRLLLLLCSLLIGANTDIVNLVMKDFQLSTHNAFMTICSIKKAKGATFNIKATSLNSEGKTLMMTRLLAINGWCQICNYIEGKKICTATEDTGFTAFVDSAVFPPQNLVHIAWCSNETAIAFGTVDKLTTEMQFSYKVEEIRSILLEGSEEDFISCEGEMRCV